MSVRRTVYTLFPLLILLIVVAFSAQPAFSNRDFEGESSGKSVRVKSENRQSVRQAPPPDSHANNHTQSSSQNSQTPNVRNSSANRDSGMNATSSIADSPMRSTVCFRGDGDILSRLHGVYRCEVPITDEPGGPAAPAQPGVVAQAPAAFEPVELVITSTQLAELIPDTPQILMDRGHFGLKNAHTNFYVSSHQPQTMTQTMFGQQVTITATPIEYRWDYGDGTTLATHLPGYPTDDFNLQTDTSHRYSDSGPYTVNLTTVFEGTYQVDGGPPQAVSSPVTQQADPVDIQIWRAVTRNVAQSCLEDPTAWGC